MLASVTSLAEARIVLQAGADIIDLKNPGQGALGALPIDIIRDITTKIASGKTTRPALSATIGDLPMVPEPIAEAVQATAASAVDYVKIGLFADLQQRQWQCIERLRPLCAQGIRIVIVMFADQKPDLSLLNKIAEVGCVGAMLDTADKNSGGLRDCLTTTELSAFVEQARALNLLTGLAGSLRLDDIEPLLSLNPDYLGFRGALCDRSQRTAGIDADAVAAVRALIPSQLASRQAVSF